MFFKEVIDEKLQDPSFREFYERECHICATTMKVIARLEKSEEPLLDILNELNISRQFYEDLKDAESCDPELVMQLCIYLGIKEPDLFKGCMKLR